MTTWARSSGYDFLARQLLHGLLSMPDHPPALLLWVLFVGAVSVFGVDDRRCLEDWDTVRGYLESMPWVHCIHDERAKEVQKQAAAASLAGVEAQGRYGELHVVCLVGLDTRGNFIFWSG